ncbi:MAG: ferredoxin, partial [Chloroflexota bacterium]
MTNDHQIVLLPSGRRGTVPEGTTLLEAARSLGVDIESICGGKQICGKCLISPEFGEFAKHGITADASGVSAPDAVERDYAERHNLNLEEVRLSCAATLCGDAVLNVPERSLARKQSIRKAARDVTVTVDPACRLYYVDVEPSTMGTRGDWKRIKAALEKVHGVSGVTLDPALLPMLQRALRECDWTITVTVWNDREVIAVQPGFSEKIYGLAVDVGSTTIAGHLANLRTGEIIGTHSVMNPQVRYGEDLMSRVSYGMMNAGGVDKMHRAVVKSLNTLAKEIATEADIDPAHIAEVILVGNTVMHHIMLNIDPVELGGAPFALATEEAIDMKARDFGLKSIGRGSMVHILPCIAGHVGADNTAVLLSEFSGARDNISLVVDIGTNAEIL